MPRYSATFGFCKSISTSSTDRSGSRAILNAILHAVTDFLQPAVGEVGSPIFCQPFWSTWLAVNLRPWGMSK